MGKRQYKKWTKEECKLEALKHSSRIEWKLKHCATYAYALKKKWNKFCCSHMTAHKKRDIYWTEQRCQSEALLYTSRWKFKAGSGGAYNAAKKNNLLDKICSHMKAPGHRFKRLIYIYEFNDKHVYVGLTYSIKDRHNDHTSDRDSSVYQHWFKTGIVPKITVSNFMHVDKAKIYEGEVVEKYKKNGYIILNKAKTGAVGGGNIRWTLERCIADALNYKTRGEFAKKSNSAYNAVRRYGWMEIVCAHMITLRDCLPRCFWTKDRCLKEALKYKARMEFQENSGGAYMACLRNDWLNEACVHMNSKPNGYWNKDRCKAEALKYKNRRQFNINSPSAYSSSLKHKWIDEVCVHMKML